MGATQGLKRSIRGVGMRAWRVGFFLCAAALVATPALAQQRLSIENFPRDKKNALRAEVASAVCSQAECVPPSRVQTRKKVDWKKVARERLTAVLSGSLTGKGAKEKLVLTLVSAQKKIVWRKVIPMVRGKLPPRPLGTATQ